MFLVSFIVTLGLRREGQRRNVLLNAGIFTPYRVWDFVRLAPTAGVVRARIFCDGFRRALVLCLDFCDLMELP